MQHVLRCAALLVVIALAIPRAAVAQESIEWSTLDGGGGRSSGGNYILGGTIGQADADVVSLCSADGGAGCNNAAWRLTGGFWVGVAPAPASGCDAEGVCVFRDGFEEDGG